MKRKISLLSFLFVGVLAFFPLSTTAHNENLPKLENRRYKCLVTPKDKNSRVNVRSRPSNSARIVRTLRDNTYINVTKIENGWAYIIDSDHGKVKGWISEEYISC